MGNSALLSDVHGNAHQIGVQPAGPSEERAMYRLPFIHKCYGVLIDHPRNKLENLSKPFSIVVIPGGL